MGIVPTLTEGTTGELTGFVVLAGGGMGMSHSRPDDTYPLLAQPVAWVPPQHVGAVVEAIVTTQRDHGNRDDRARARLKYLLDERGVDWLRDEIAARTGHELAEPVELPAWQVHTHHGWHDNGSGSSFLGLPVLGGTLADRPRAALRRLVNDGAITGLRVTPRQDLLLLGIDDPEAVENVLRANDIELASDRSDTRNLAIACPALPTCSKALGEAERVLPEVVDRLEKLLADTGNTGLPLRVNMTGCPNGCTRPYAAELGIVGRSKRTYDVYVGGSPGGDRLAWRLRADVAMTELADTLRPLLERFGRETEADDPVSFGDWCDRTDRGDLLALLPPPATRGSRRRSERPTT